VNKCNGLTVTWKAGNTGEQTESELGTDADNKTGVCFLEHPVAGGKTRRFLGAEAELGT